jgi:hypothetical protein
MLQQTRQSVEQFLAKLKLNIHPIPLIWLFPKVKSTLEERIFQDIKDIQKSVMMALMAIPEQEFQKCFQQ